MLFALFLLIERFGPIAPSCRKERNSTCCGCARRAACGEIPQRSGAQDGPGPELAWTSASSASRTHLKRSQRARAFQLSGGEDTRVAPAHAVCAADHGGWDVTSGGDPTPGVVCPRRQMARAHGYLGRDGATDESRVLRPRARSLQRILRNLLGSARSLEGRRTDPHRREDGAMAKKSERGCREQLQACQR